MSGIVLSLCWGAFVYGLCMLPKIKPGTEDYNGFLAIVVCTGILGPGMTLLWIALVFRRKQKKQAQKLPEATPYYVIV